MNEAAANYLQTQQRNQYQRNDQPYDPGAPASRREDMGQMSLDQSHARDPNALQ